MPRTALCSFMCGLLLVMGAACATLPREGPTPALPEAGRWIEVTDLTMVLQQGTADCGTAALSMMLERYDPACDAPAIRRTLGSDGEHKGVAASRLREIAEQRGLDAYLIQGTLDDLQHELSQGRPVLVGLMRVVGTRGYPHYAVVVGIDPTDGKILTADPADGWKERSYSEFEERWKPAHNLALVILPKAGGTPPWPGLAPTLPSGLGSSTQGPQADPGAEKGTVLLQR